MTPWPADVHASYNLSPTTSPMQQSSQDPFAAFGAPAPAMPTGETQPQSQQPQQQPQQQPPAADPWAAMAAPSQAPPAVPPPAVAPAQNPPAVVAVDGSAGSNAPPSPMGDVSVLAASGLGGGVAPSTQAPPQATTTPANPFDFGAVAAAVPQAAAPTNAPPGAPPSPPDQPPQQQPSQQPPAAAQAMSPPTSPIPNSFAPQSSGYADPFGYAFSPISSPVANPANAGALVPSQAANVDPFGVAPPPFGQAPAAPLQPRNQAPSAAPPQPPAAADPFAAFGGPPAAAPPVPPPAASDDPFGVFDAAPPAPAPVQAPPAPVQAPVQAPAQAQVPEEDPWAAAGFGPAAPAPAQPPSQPAPAAAQDSDAPVALGSDGLPDGGEYYEARINARSLGAMFYTAAELADGLYHKLPAGVVSALAHRPVVAYVAEEGAAWNAGIHLGHVILSVNGEEVTDPEHCAGMIRAAPRPMNVRCWVPPNMTLTLNEGRHMVKYDKKDLDAPKSVSCWKRKYVVVGGIVTKPWIMNMFYRKKDYDIAVKEAHAGKKISVKVKQFDLRNARIILRNRDGQPDWVEYPSEQRPWYYITILPAKGYPIKISSESLEELEPVYSAVRRLVRKETEQRYQQDMEGSFGGYDGRDGYGGNGGGHDRGAYNGGGGSAYEGGGYAHGNHRGGYGGYAHGGSGYGNGRGDGGSGRDQFGQYDAPRGGYRQDQWR